MKPGGLKTWLLASRPKTLPAAVAPVIMGAAMAYGDGVHHFPSAIVALVCALLIQVNTNFVNDYADFKKGTDDPERIGPLRVTQAGLVTPQQMKRAIWLTVIITALLGLYLVYRGGWPIAVIGALSILSGILYTEGPYPLGYLGLGDVFVLIFFGPVAVGGTYYVQALTVNWVVILAGFAPGLLSVAILTVNNMRDIEGDKKTGKKTLAVRFGRGFAMKEYFYSVLAACLIPVVIYLVTDKYKLASLGGLTLFFTPGVLGVIFSKTDGPSLNKALAVTGRLLLIYGVLFSIGWIFSSR
ncbi:MAG: 1,4-dihydroxy-2-naphthoate polyprenyltransferase [Candidatus Aminicenantes bacterium]|nr:1,4-dihydroxy-2-naphthoate polyprenyltransferase [Candidatus Aminicenantes bacterium]NIM81839.1 1,4-dihydroxy-2-naphthoate polyprenyltransferase [Candidatus Aminicenantes bacterium]NIN21212.1 1,4-dihydroxy-2-naphthoate polyprenyltransferase [Candidatus Aminicenantes bacterium]NIN45036.1 1,4-dihydroxy-2-naphthoate polyprenyltransferase [Candidatus Aminicenantes bacterium]NIN87854.1 1,4-dihydroxy-2-naphthoate polyprenyltransferase [Candidatus Aminicenantes bacterium]